MKKLIVSVALASAALVAVPSALSIKRIDATDYQMLGTSCVQGGDGAQHVAARVQARIFSIPFGKSSVDRHQLLGRAIPTTAGLNILRRFKSGDNWKRPFKFFNTNWSSVNTVLISIPDTEKAWKLQAKIHWGRVGQTTDWSKTITINSYCIKAGAAPVPSPKPHAKPKAPTTAPAPPEPTAVQPPPETTPPPTPETTPPPPPPTDQPPPDSTKVCPDGSVVLVSQFCPLPPGPS